MGIEIALALGHKLHLQKLGRKYVDKCNMDRKSINGWKNVKTMMKNTIKCPPIMSYMIDWNMK